MNIYRKRSIFRQRSQSNVYRMFLWVVLILGGIWLIRGVQRGEIKPLFQPTATPTRLAGSYALEAEAQFTAGQLNAAITAYQEAVRVDPNNAEAWAKLARIQTYSTALLVTDSDRKVRLAEALGSIDKAVAIAPEDSTVHAIRSFVLDWNASPNLVCTPEEVVEKNTCKEVGKLLTEADQEANRAIQLDSKNILALAFYAEILVDEQRWTQADQYISQALESGSNVMDVHRVHAYVQESLGEYTLAIEAYDRAIAIAPNLTFLYLRAGANYRRLAFDSPNEEIQRQLYEKSLEYFAQCARINQQLGVEDPVPYLSISRTYSQMGEFFIAARNVQKALEFQPANADIYGQLGVVYFKSRNYEGSIPALQCAVRGCSGEDSCKGRGLDGCDDENLPIAVEGLALSPNTVVYYYTYGSVLAALSRPKDNHCGEAMDVLDEVKAAFSSDRDISGIVAAGEEICQSLAEGELPGSNSTPEATLTSEPVMTETPIPSATP
jgi:tetratricopeptide (TPR) repeat protein